MSYFPRVLRADKQTQSSHRAVYLRVLIGLHGNNYELSIFNGNIELHDSDKRVLQC